MAHHLEIKIVSTLLPSCTLLYISKMKSEWSTAMGTRSARCSLLYLLPARLWVSLPPCCPGSACLIWHLLFGRGEAVRRPNARRGPGWGNPIDKDTLQARNRCTRLSEAELSLCWDGRVVIYLGAREIGREGEGRR